MTRSLLIVGALALLAAACSSSAKDSASDTEATTSTTSVVAAPTGLPAFYSVPLPLPATPGAVLKSEVVPVEGLHGTMHRVMYVSKSVHGQPVAVTGLIAVPKSTPPAGGFPVVSWGHGTNGMADKCAPSIDPTDSQTVALGNTLLDQGWVVTASDYEGEGTPGLMPYIAGISAARSVIDIVRAAENMPDAHASKDYVVWGHSEGGHTAMFALNIGPTYAPELKLHGVVAGAPPSQFQYIYNYLKTSPFKHYILMAAGGLNAAYGDTEAPLDQVLTPYGMSLLPVLDKGCSDYVAEQVANVDIAQATKTDPFTVPAWKKILTENDPQGFTSVNTVPLLMIQGGNDEQIPVVSTKLLADHLCGLGQDLSRWIYPGQSHAGVIGPSSADMTHWIKDRFAGGPTPDPYKPTGQSNIEITTCPKA